MQRLEPRVLRGQFLAARLVGVLERGRQPDPLGLRFGETGFHPLEPGLRRGERVVQVEQAARHLRRVVERLVEHRLHGAALLVRQQEFLRGGGGLGFEPGHFLVGRGGALGGVPAFVARRLQVDRLLLHGALQLGDLGAARGELGELFGLGRFERLDALLGDGQHLAQPDAFAVERRGLPLGVDQVLALLAVGDPRVVEHALQAELLGLGLFEGAQRLADRDDQPAERVPDGVELGDLVLGVDQEIAHHLVFFAELRCDREEQLLIELQHVFARRRRSLRRLGHQRGFAAEQRSEFGH